jgi:hypothetical protein
MPGPIKIGYSIRPTHRRKQLNYISPVNLLLEIAVKAPREMEHRLHAAFAGSRLWGEWFEPHDQITSLIDKLKAGRLLESVAPECSDPSPCRSRSHSDSVREKMSYTRRLASYERSTGTKLDAPAINEWRKRARDKTRGIPMPDAVKAEIDAFVAIPVSKKRRAA